jgi:lipopolysaccharide transport system permease protein
VPGRLLALWRYRGFIASMVRRDFAHRYVGSVLGAAWLVLNPLAFIVIYTLVFSQVMQSRVQGRVGAGPYAYGVFLCAALLPWTFFAEMLNRCLTVFLDHRTLLKHQNFPRSVLPAVAVLSASLTFAIVYGLFLAFLLLTGNWPGWKVLGLLPPLAIQQALAVGLGVALGTLNVYFRDVAQATGVVLQFWFWLTPVVYPIEIVPPAGQWLLRANPMLPLVTAYRTLVFERAWPDWWSFLWPLAVAIAALAFAQLVFRRLGQDMVDEL